LILSIYLVIIYSALINLLMCGTSFTRIGICFPRTALSYKLLLKKSPTMLEAPQARTTGRKMLTDYDVSMVTTIIEYVILVYPANIEHMARIINVTLKSLNSFYSMNPTPRQK